MWSGFFFDGLTAEAKPVQVSLTPATLELSGLPPGHPASWNLSSLQLVAVGNARMDLATSDQPEVRLRVDGADFAEALKAAAPELWRPQWRRTGKIVGGLMAVAAVFVAGLFYLPQLMVPLISASYAERIGAGVTAQVTGLFGGACNMLAGQAALEELAYDLAGEAELDHPIVIHVVDSRVVNALAAPGGHILVFDGLIQKANSPSEVAGVLAHEIGHVKYKHSLTSLSRSIGAQFILTSMMGGSFGDTSSVLLTTSFGRAAEDEADETAIQILNARGISSEPFAQFFDRIGGVDTDADSDAGEDGESKSSWIKVGNLLSTHPPTPERAALVREKGLSEGTSPMSESEWRDLKAICETEDDVF